MPPGRAVQSATGPAYRGSAASRTSWAASAGLTSSTGPKASAASVAARTIPSEFWPASGWTQASVIPLPAVKATSVPRRPPWAGAASSGAPKAEAPRVRKSTGRGPSVVVAVVASAQPLSAWTSAGMLEPLGRIVWAGRKRPRPTSIAVPSSAVRPATASRRSWWRRQISRTCPRWSIFGEQAPLRPAVGTRDALLAAPAVAGALDAGQDVALADEGDGLVAALADRDRDRVGAALARERERPAEAAVAALDRPDDPAGGAGAASW